PGLLQPEPLGVGYTADREEAVRGGDDPAVGELDLHAVTDPPHGGRAGAGEHVHAAAPEDGLDELGGVLVLTGQHAVAAGDERDRDAPAVVGAGEPRPGDTGADDDEVLGRLGDPVHLRPGEDALAVRPGVGQDPRVGAGGDEDDLPNELLLPGGGGHHDDEIGRASCRERG